MEHFTFSFPYFFDKCCTDESRLARQKALSTLRCNVSRFITSVIPPAFVQQPEQDTSQIWSVTYSHGEELLVYI